MMKGDERLELWRSGGTEEEKKRRRRGGKRAEGRDATAVADRLASGPRKACQGLNGITPRVIDFTALGEGPMCQELQKITSAILTLRCSRRTNTLVPHSKRGIE